MEKMFSNRKTSSEKIQVEIMRLKFVSQDEIKYSYVTNMFNKLLNIQHLLELSLTLWQNSTRLFNYVIFFKQKKIIRCCDAKSGIPVLMFHGNKVGSDVVLEFLLLNFAKESVYNLVWN